MNPFGMFVPHTLRTWVIIWREMVGSTTSLMRRIGDEGRRGTLERCSWKVPRVLLHHFLRLHGQRQYYHWLVMWRWFVLHLFEFNLFFFLCFIFLYLLHFTFIFLFSLFICVLGGSVIACRSIQHHMLALESDIDIFKSLLLPMREPKHEHISRQVAAQRGSVFAPSPLPEDGKVEFWFVMWVSSMLASNLYVCISIFLDHSFFACAHVFISRPVCLEFQRRARSVSSLQTCLQPL